MRWVSQLEAVISLVPQRDFAVRRAPEDPHAPSPAGDLRQACWGCCEHDDPFPGRWTVWDSISQAFSLQANFCSDFDSHYDRPAVGWLVLVPMPYWPRVGGGMGTFVPFLPRSCFSPAEMCWPSRGKRGRKLPLR